jgi:amidophosphoribosyltransferase
MGNRPLCIGKLGDAWIVASETCALDHIKAEYVREVQPGEVIIVDADGLHAEQVVEPDPEALCMFEYIYFARPDSSIRDQRIYPMRMAMGAELAREFPVEADIVIGVPDSATAAAIGYADESGLPFREGLIKNRYVGRTFIQPDQRLREAGVHLKFNPVSEILSGKRVVVVDDSIVRGTTTRSKMLAIRRAGAKEIHLRISCPPIRNPCFYGIDFATRKELIANERTIDQIREFVEVDSLSFLSLEGLLSAFTFPHKDACTACWSGHYKVPIDQPQTKFSFERDQLKMF